jgi:hypothetical protein
MVLTGDDSERLGPGAVAQARARMAAMGMDTASVSDDQIQAYMADAARRFRDEAPTTAAQAATIILDGVRTERWRILVGEDAYVLDSMVRADPEKAYEPEFFSAMAEKAGWRVGG